MIETVILSVFLTCRIPFRRCEDSNCDFYSSQQNNDEEHKQYSVEPVIFSGFSDLTGDVLAKDFGSVPQVQYVLTEDISDTMLVWIILDDSTLAIRRRVYEKELSLISEFPEIPFDFNVIPSRGRLPEDIVSGARVIYSRPK
jgi:hypothetical protein